MGRLLPILGIIAALVICAVSAAMNYLFLSSLGKTALEGQVLGAASAAADVLKALLPFFIAWSWQARRLVAAASGLLAFAFFAVFSFLSAIGFAADNRGTLVEGREAISAEYRRVQRSLGNAENRRSGLPAHRPVAVVTEEIGAHRQSRRWSATKACTNATESESRAYCAEYFRLRAELAAGNEAQRLAVQIGALHAEGARLRESGAGQDSDPQVSLLSRITGRAQEPVRLALIVAVALLVEIGASLGLFLASGHQITHVAPERDGSAPSTAVSDPPVGSVEDFCLEALMAAPRVVINDAELFDAYCAWCAASNFTALSASAFQRRFRQLAQAVGLRQIKDGYVGVNLAKRDRTARLHGLPPSACSRARASIWAGRSGSGSG